MVLVRCGIMGVTRPNLIWGRNLRRGSGTGTVSIIDYGYGRVGLAERVDLHAGAANKQLAPPRRKVRATGGAT